MIESDELGSPSLNPGAAVVTLEGIVRRSQGDFEIDFFEQILTRSPDHVPVLRCLADLFADRKLHRRALQMDQRLAELQPGNAVVMYNLACSQSLVGEPLTALRTLDRAVQYGLDDWSAIETDPDLAAVRALPHFAALYEGWLACAQPASGPGEANERG